MEKPWFRCSIIEHGRITEIFERQSANLQSFIRMMKKELAKQENGGGGIFDIFIFNMENGSPTDEIFRGSCTIR